jgi:hypothetical protein
MVRKGDRIRYAGESGEVEFVVDPDAVDATTAWYAKQFGAGCMIVTKKWGSILVHEAEQEEDLEFVSRIAPD